MAHRSRLCAFIIDSETDDLAGAARFWSAALGAPIAADGQLEQGRYARLEMPADQPIVEVQRVAHPSRVHLDIETDDVAAEVARLESLGAQRVAEYPRWVVMEAPTGHRFCVVHQQTAGFERTANRWD